MSTKYKFRNEDGIYFITLTCINWIDVFTRRIYKDIIIGSLLYCTKEKGMIIYGYVIMSNHLHLIISKQTMTSPFSAIIRDFKKFTAMQLIKCISSNPQESRSEWLLWMMAMAGKKNCNNTKYQFWQQNNKPIELDGNWLDQKLEYIHQNPVEAGYVNEAFEYFYSSARNYAGLSCALSITSLFDGKII